MNTLETAILGGGCFWCTEAVFLALNGVYRVESGYCGGHQPDPDYALVCSGQTEYAEVVRIEFNPQHIHFRTLLEIFFETHNPTTLNRQGNDIGPQYRSVIFCQTETQKQTARSLIAELEAQQIFEGPIVTEIACAAPYYPAEAEHQNYFNKNPAQAYCAAIIPPKLGKLKTYFSKYMKPA